MLHFSTRLAAIGLGIVAACVCIASAAVHVSTFLDADPFHVASAEFHVTSTEVDVLHVLSWALFLVAGFWAACRGTKTPKAIPSGEQGNIASAGQVRRWVVAVLLVVGVYTMLNMIVFGIRTKGISSIPSSYGVDAELGDFSDGRTLFSSGKLRVLTPEEHAWYHRLLARFATGHVMLFSLVAVLLFFGLLPGGERRNSPPVNGAPPNQPLQQTGPA